MENNSTNKLIPYRIRIGVTGHRELNNIEAIREKIREAITYKIYDLYDKESKETFKSLKNTPIALSIITPLADGADRIVAREVLNTNELRTEPEKKINAQEVLNTKDICTESGKRIPISDTRLEAVLPLKKADYLEDFETEESRSEFEELISLSRRPISLKENLLKDEPGNVDLGQARKQAYLDIGKYVVDNCDVLIALWNGKPAAGKGGTAEVIEYAQKKDRPVLIISTVDPVSDITIIKGSGLNSESLTNIDFFNCYEMDADSKNEYISNIYEEYFPVFPKPEGKKKSLFKKFMNKLENLFYYGSFSPPKEEEEIKETKEKKITDAELNKIIDSIPQGTKDLIREKLLPFYAKASSISKKYQNYYMRAGTIVYLLSSLSAILIAVVIMFHETSQIIFIILFFMLLSAYAVVRIADKKRVRKKWIENRFLAERIRSSVFLAICGIEVSTITIPPFNTEALKVDDWMIIAFDEIWKSVPAMKGCPAVSLKDYSDYVRIFWIKDQIKYHKNKSFKSGKKNHFYERLGWLIFFLAVVMAFLHVLSHFLNMWEELLLAIVIILPAMGAAAGGIRSHREFSRLEKRSRNMTHPLTDFKDSLTNVDDPEDFETTLRSIENLMLDETQDWLLIMRFVTLEPEA